MKSDEIKGCIVPNTETAKTLVTCISCIHAPILHHQWLKTRSKPHKKDSYFSVIQCYNCLHFAETTKGSLNNCY